MTRNLGSMGIAVRDLTFGGGGRAERAPHPQMWSLSKPRL